MNSLTYFKYATRSDHMINWLRHTFYVHVYGKANEETKEKSKDRQTDSDNTSPDVG